MMETLSGRVGAIAAERTTATKAAIATTLQARLPADVMVECEEEGVIITTSAAAIRLIRDPGFAMLRDGVTDLLR
jgi:hypothetical protein